MVGDTDWEQIDGIADDISVRGVGNIWIVSQYPKIDTSSSESFLYFKTYTDESWQLIESFGCHIAALSIGPAYSFFKTSSELE